MSSVIVNGTLILNGNLTCDGDITVTPIGLVLPVPDPDLMESFYSLRTNSYTTSNGAGRSMTSTMGDIDIEGAINGIGQGFSADQGPGCNSLSLDQFGNRLIGYGATHAGTGNIIMPPGQTAPAPKFPYGSRETPVSLGSGAGSYHDVAHFFNDEIPAGGGAIKIEAHSGTLTVNGSINVSGQNGGPHTGGAAGGSIWLIGWNITGHGLLSSAGGQTPLLVNGGDGGGGYISIWYDNALTFSGQMSVEGMEDGKIFITQTEPLFEERFTGTIWNQKWWNPAQNHVVLDNNVALISDQSNYSFPSVDSIFTVSGENITAQVDYLPSGTTIPEYEAQFILMADPLNYVGLAKKDSGIFGVSSINGIIASSGIPFPNIPITLRLMKLDSTFFFQYYDSTSTPQTIYSDVLPTLEDSNFNVFLELDKPSSNIRSTIRRLSPLDISREYVEMDSTPSDASSVAFNIITGSPQNYGTDFTVVGDQISWDLISSNLPSLLVTGDIVRMIYDVTAAVGGFMDATFDSFKLFEGVVANYETKEPVIYVDPDFGSDSSDGRQLNPLQNLFVATAWAKRGGTVVLYDGTHNPTYVARKNLTIRGAEGAKPLVTSQYVQDTIGSGWETNALSFYGSEGLIYNVQVASSYNGIVLNNSAQFQLSQNLIHDTSVGISVTNCDPLIDRNRVYNTTIGVDVSACSNFYIYSNLIYDSPTGILISDTTDAEIVGNTLDNCSITGVSVQNDSSVIVSSNNITNSQTGLTASLDSTVGSFFNNYFQDFVDYSIVPNDSSGDFEADPLYVNRFGPPAGKDFHIQIGSPDIQTGQTLFDRYMIDFDGANRADGTLNVDVGAFTFIDGTHFGDFYVSGDSSADDYRNFGGIGDPFRTLDKAMLVADATIHIDTGYYDSYYLNLQAETISLNHFSIFSIPLQHFILYFTLSPSDIAAGQVALPAFINSDDTANIAVNVVGGGSQLYGIDYNYNFNEGWFYKPFLSWNGLALASLLAAGDTLRVMFSGPLQRKAYTNLILESHYSNIEKEKAIFVSPNGSDSTVIGGDGTNTGGNGTFALPYRTVDMALANSNPGDYVVAISGEYPLFTPVGDRVLVPATDRTSINSSKRVYQDLFYPLDFRAFGTTQSDPVPWNFESDGSSSASSGGGFLNLTFDGTNTAAAISQFQIVNDFCVSAVLRNALAPVFFTIASPDNTMFFSYDSSNYQAGVTTGGITYTCTGLTNGQMDTSQFITDYLPITTNDIINKYVPLNFIPDGSSCQDIALNIVGGTSQELGDDFYVQDSKIKWDGKTLDGELVPGDVLRVIYQGEGLSNPLPVKMCLQGQRFTITIFDPVERIVSMRDMVGSYIGPWIISFYVNGGAPLPCAYGKGFVSQFLTIADSFQNMTLDQPMAVKTEHKNIGFYDPAYLVPVPSSPAPGS
jgi:Periplasmic copper-binding protein (NosD)